jgi:hypothetical protein
VATSGVVERVLLPVERAPVERIEIARGPQRNRLVLRWRRILQPTPPKNLTNHGPTRALAESKLPAAYPTPYLEGNVSRCEEWRADAESGGRVRGARLIRGKAGRDFRDVPPSSLQGDATLVLGHHHPFTAMQ